MSQDAPKPTGLTKLQIELFAKTFADALGYHPNHPIHLLIEKLGGRIIYEDLGSWDNSQEFIDVYGPNDFEIKLPTFTSPKRDKFTIAHELAHYVLHSKFGEIPLSAFRKRTTSPAEFEANIFAAALLMPEELFREKADEFGNLKQVASYFGVSESAASVRCHTLGIALGD